MSTKLPAAILSAVLAAAATAQTAPAAKTAILQVQNGILNTHEGHQSFSDLDAKYAPKKADLDKQQNDIAALQEQFRKNSATMLEEAQRKMARDIEKRTKVYNFEADSTRADYEQDQADIMEALAKKFHAVVDKYAKDNGFAVVLDISNPQTPAFWWASAMDITNDVVRAYDLANPVTVTPPAAR